MHVATIEYTNCMHTLKQKVRTKEKREVRGIVDNDHISLKNRQITRIRLGKKVTVQCSFLIKVGYIVLYNSVVITGGLKMIEVKSFLAALKITWLKRILINDGKITKILNAFCPAVKSIKDRIGEFANILMLRANSCFWVGVFKH